MGRKTSVVPQMDFLNPALIPKSHRPTKLTGEGNQKVLWLLRTHGIAGRTSEEIERQLDWVPNSAGPRLAELKALGLARKTEARRNGHRVWMCAAPEARDE